MELNAFLLQLKNNPESISFNDTIATIDAHYEFTPTTFQNGTVLNEAGKNSGSCKIFSFAQLHDLSPEDTLHCFGDYYRKDVLTTPNGADHQNIRTFIVNGWAGVEFGGKALLPK